jgi:hypothetical protein
MPSRRDGDNRAARAALELARTRQGTHLGEWGAPPDSTFEAMSL